jgi:hypothetical protein
LDLCAVASESFIDCVIDDLIDEVVEAALTGRSDIHTWSLADRLKALEDGDGRGVVALLLLAHPASIGYFEKASNGLICPISSGQAIILVVNKICKYRQKPWVAEIGKFEPAS